jgi:hypothetical protein
MYKKNMPSKHYAIHYAEDEKCAAKVCPLDSHKFSKRKYIQ